MAVGRSAAGSRAKAFNTGSGVVAGDRAEGMLVLLLQESGILSPYIQAALTLWPVWIVVVGIFAAIAGYRIFEKTGIHKTNTARIEALSGLVETRDQELTDANDELADLRNQLDAIESEYKAVAGIKIAELIQFAGNYEQHRADLETKESRIRILEARLHILELREIENLEIHKSK